MAEKQIFGRKTEWSSVIMDDGTVQSRFRIFLRFQASARPPYVVSVYNNSTCSKTRIILRILIDRTIIYAAKKHHTKTNESTIKTAVPRGCFVHLTTMFQLMPCPASSTMTGDCAADAVTASGAFCSFRHAASFIPAALTARIPKNNALLVTIFLISGFIYITSEMF